jgi:antitoxin HicB
MDYPITLERESAGRVRVSFPDFPGAYAEGDNESEGLRRARHVLASAIGTHIRERRPLPRPSSSSAQRLPVPALIEAKIKLYESMRAARVGKADLARRLQWHLPQVDRLFDVMHASRLEQLEAAFAVLGKRLVLDVTDDHGRPEPARGLGKGAARAEYDRPPEAVEAQPFDVQWD